MSRHSSSELLCTSGLDVLNCFQSEEQVKEPEFSCSPTFDGLEALALTQRTNYDTALWKKADEQLFLQSSLDGLIADLQSEE